jgi:hypothetical protein
MGGSGQGGPGRNQLLNYSRSVQVIPKLSADCAQRRLGSMHGSPRPIQSNVQFIPDMGRVRAPRPAILVGCPLSKVAG